MALIVCKDCSKEFSTDAKRCPNCGARKPKKKSYLKWLIYLVLIYFIGLVVFLQNYAEPKNASMVNYENLRHNIESPARPIWQSSTSEDKMTNKTIYIAYNQSSNILNFDFPYAGPQHATLMLRKHPRNGLSVLLSIEKGQFICDVDGCVLLVRFDDGAAETFKASESESRESTMLFIEDEKRFIRKLQAAKKLRIEASFYQEGFRVIEFDGTDSETIRLFM
jgi:hypothetical protein